jgi:ferredoxin-NADP reductase
VLEVEDVGPGLRILRIGRPPGLTFRAGQHVKVGLAGTRRGTFSIASAPHEAHLELCIERIPGGRLTPALFDVAPGVAVEMTSKPKGGFTLDEQATTHLMVGTTTGIAPLRSMIRDLRHRGVAAEVVLLHGASHADELPYHDELVALAAGDPRLLYVPTVSRPTEARNRGWSGRTGRVDDLALDLARSLAKAGTHVYACGNAGMVERVADELGARGFSVSTEAYD